MQNLRHAPRRGCRALSFMRLFLLSLAVVIAAVPTPAFAADRGVIAGRVTNETTGKPAAGVQVILSGADEDGSSRIRRSARTGPDGRYRFDGLPSSNDWLYVVDARSDGGLFPGRPFGFPQGETPTLQTTLKVWDTTSDPKSVLVSRDAMFVLPSERGVGVVESVTIVNQTQLAYIGRGDTSDDERTTFGFGLPSGATDVGIQDASLDIPGLVETDFGFGITVAVPPGETRVTYTYRVPGDGATHVLSKTALYPTADLLVFAGDPLEIDGDRLRRSGTITVDGKRYARWIAPGFVEAGDTVLIQAVAEAAIDWRPFALGAAGLVVAITAAYVLMRRRAPRVEPATESRDDLIAEIARLDVEYENGALEKDKWAEQRDLLKSRLLELERA